ncbi:MAG: class I SAM-dependent methyltransferase [Bacteroidales bacterium]
MKKRSQVKTHYDEYTKHYLSSGYGKVIQAHRPTNVEDLLAYTARQAGIKDGMYILDVGCGVCGPAVYFAEHFDVKIDALTISEEQINYSKKFIAEKNLDDKIKLVKGDFHIMDKYFEKETYDLILMLESYGHAKCHKKVIQSAEKVLKKEGRIYIKDYFQKEITGRKQRKNAVKRAIRNMNKTYAYNLPDLIKTIKYLREANMNLLQVNRNKLPLDNEKSVQQFEGEHNIDIFEGGFHYNFLEPLELLFFKPENIDDPII